jgi:endonuclease/exonuclease/phosphatase family metal-dependent hydrolase
MPHRLHLAAAARACGILLCSLSAGLLAITTLAFLRMPDRLAAFTVMPLWAWGLAGALLLLPAVSLWRARPPLLLAAAWLAISASLADETAPLLRRIHTPAFPPGPKPSAPAPGQILRVATLNCAVFHFGNPAPDLLAWQPDVVLLQDAFPHQAARIAATVLPQNSHLRFHRSNAILSRFEIIGEARLPSHRALQVTLRLPNGQSLRVTNVHLGSAATDLRLHRRDAWQTHRANRQLRRQELSTILHAFVSPVHQAGLPLILGGDFNAHPTDPIHRQLRKTLIDCFADSGTGLGNTYHRRFPILRIDHLYTSPSLRPLRATTATTLHSDHRFVIADILIPAPAPPTAPH